MRVELERSYDEHRFHLRFTKTENFMDIFLADASLTFALSMNEPMGDIIDAYKSCGRRKGSDTTWNAPL